MTSETMTNRNRNLRTNSRGFTLIEIMVVMVILGLLVAIVAPNIMGRSDQPKSRLPKPSSAILPTRWTCTGWITASTRPPSKVWKRWCPNLAAAPSPKTGTPMVT